MKIGIAAIVALILGIAANFSDLLSETLLGAVVSLGVGVLTGHFGMKGYSAWKVKRKKNEIAAAEKNTDESVQRLDDAWKGLKDAHERAKKKLADIESRRMEAGTADGSPVDDLIESARRRDRKRKKIE